MKQKMYQVDAFTDKLFSGNPAAVCLLKSWLPANTMQQIAAENNLAETAFIVKEESRYHIRWFTPEKEVALCGHATLASAFVLYEYYKVRGELLSFWSLSGALQVRKEEDGTLTLDFPADKVEEIGPIPELNTALGSVPRKTFKGKTDIMLLYSSQQEIESLQPDFFLLSRLKVRGVIATAAGNTADFVSRFFAPAYGINEDPVTGSAHTTLVPYWADTLGKTKLKARQLSQRGGDLSCEAAGERVLISGRVVPYFEGIIHLPENKSVERSQQKGQAVT